MIRPLSGIAVFLVCIAGRLDAESLGELRNAARSQKYVTPSPEEVRVAGDSFQELLCGGETSGVVSGLASLGLEVVRLEVGGAQVSVVREVQGRRRGWGVYAFRAPQLNGVLLQAPHSYFDLHSGYLVERIFVEHNVRAAAWNTAPRHAPLASSETPQPCEGDSGADLAHVDRSVFQAFTLAFARTHPQGLVAQLHGFSTTARTTRVGALSDAVVSNGQRRPRPWLWSFDRCLESRLCEVSSVFPDEVRELGALKNLQGRLLRELGHGGFLHVELNLPLRKRLKDDPQLRRDFWSCLGEGMK